MARGLAVIEPESSLQHRPIHLAGIQFTGNHVVPPFERLLGWLEQRWTFLLHLG
ncbi:MAG: hypothetical protein KA072_12520 [Thermoanaerobaculaceae bacterium]|nr:hypothetical protein [Thermoanaerobaculaceae bacterium]MDI9620274.1 hypothetical protein [Acidobacteriota bacterium]NLH11220.1 hypothetical protein [Holophagae bacterium]HPW56471.1 hypothetical protein [Thermoanaerobaculaceae bacterium]